MINFLVWILFGLVAGALAKMIMPGKDGGGWLMTILLGVAGSFLGGYLGSIIFNQPVGGSNSFSLANMGLAIAGALIILFIVRKVKQRG